MDEYEEYLIKQIEDLARAYEKAAKPFVEKLILIRSTQLGVKWFEDCNLIKESNDERKSCTSVDY